MIEKNLILGGILAITIGIATIVPLEYFMSAGAQASTQDKPWFNLNVPYAYWTTYSTSSSYDASYLIALNCTVNANTIGQHTDARIEYYEISVYSDQGPITNFTYYLSANTTGAVNPATSFYFEQANWFNTTTTGGDMIVNLDSIIPLNDIGGSIFWNAEPNNSTNASFPQHALNIENAHTIYIDTYRLGYVTFDANSTVVTLADNSITQHIELTKTSNGFLYNSGVSPSQLPKYGYAQQNP